jgi:hypothetical protein
MAGNGEAANRKLQMSAGGAPVMSVNSVPAIKSRGYRDAKAINWEKVIQNISKR